MPTSTAWRRTLEPIAGSLSQDPCRAPASCQAVDVGIGLSIPSDRRAQLRELHWADSRPDGFLVIR